MFLNWVTPIIRDTLNVSGPAWSPENLYRICTYVEPSFIRVEADEVTYPAHIILRYRLEKSLVTGELTLNDLPLAWNDGMKDLLNITPKSNREGCLQDIHWFDGAWGYFPTYSLGAMSAAQIFKAACNSNSKILSSIEKGDFTSLVSWLNKNIYSKGRFFNSSELLTQVTGEDLNANHFISHLKTRYTN